MFFLHKISVVVFAVFVIVISIDPTGTILRVKELMFAFLLFLSLVSITKEDKIPKDILFVIWTCLSLPMYEIMVAMIRGNFVDSSYAFGHMKSFLFILIFFFLKKIDFRIILKVVFISGTFIALCTTLIFIIAQVNQDLFILFYNHNLTDDTVILSRREYYGFNILGIYFKTGPYMLFSYIYSLYFLKIKKYKMMLILLNLFALLIAGSRTPSLIAIFITIVYFYDRLKSNVVYRYMLLYICVCALSFLTYKLATEEGDASNEIKYADFQSYITNFFLGTNSVWGAGLGSVFYSAGRGKLVSATEQTYMDIFRIYGFGLGTILIALFFYPVLFFLRSKYRYIQKYQRFIMAYMLYLILAGTNPLLISSTGMLIWAIGLTFIYKIKTNQLEIT